MAFVAVCVSLGHSLAPDLWLLQGHCLLRCFFLRLLLCIYNLLHISEETLRQFWPGQDAKFQEREEACKAFNEKHRWRKRGISILAVSDRVPK